MLSFVSIIDLLLRIFFICYLPAKVLKNREICKYFSQIFSKYMLIFLCVLVTYLPPSTYLPPPKTAFVFSSFWLLVAGWQIKL